MASPRIVGIKINPISEKLAVTGVNPLDLSGSGWLRLLASGLNLAAFVGWCPRCRAGELVGPRCRACAAELVRFDESFWIKVGKRIRRALTKDRALVRLAKAEWESLYGTQRKPSFPGQLKWLAKAWEDVQKPSHRPFSPKLHYQVANWVRSMQKLGLSKGEIVDIMAGEDFSDGPIKRGRKDYANIPGEELRKLREGFQQIAGKIPGNLLNLEEIWRTMKWVDRQRQDPMARLRGERVRKRERDRDPNPPDQQ